MNFLKNLALVASLSLVGMGAAQAAGLLIPMDAGDPAVFENSWTYNTGGTDTLPGLGETGPAGTTFADYFLFNVPEDEYVSFSLFGSKVTFKAPPGSLDPYGFVLYGLGGSPFVVDAKTGSTLHSIEGGEYKLTSGVYELDVFGSFTGRNGTYDVSIFGTPVPEPSGWALLLAGLGVTGLMARRRKQQA